MTQRAFERAVALERLDEDVLAAYMIMVLMIG